MCDATDYPAHWGLQSVAICAHKLHWVEINDINCSFSQRLVDYLNQKHGFQISCARRMHLRSRLEGRGTWGSRLMEFIQAGML